MIRLPWLFTVPFVYGSSDQLVVLTLGTSSCGVTPPHLLNDTLGGCVELNRPDYR